MKTRIFIALSVLGMLFSCKDKENPLGDVPGLEYLLSMEIIDQDGNNVLKDAELGIVDSVYNEAIYMKYDKQEMRKPSIWNRLIANKNYLILQTMVVVPIRNCPDSVTWKFRSKDIFGDEQTHIIESSWDRDGESFSLRCTSFEFEGKTYVPELKNEYWTARVVINR